jgi:MOSC domain-containing protein YiiM
MAGDVGQIRQRGLQLLQQCDERVDLTGFIRLGHRLVAGIEPVRIAAGIHQLDPQRAWIVAAGMVRHAVDIDPAMRGTVAVDVEMAAVAGAGLGIKHPLAVRARSGEVGQFGAMDHDEVDVAGIARSQPRLVGQGIDVDVQGMKRQRAGRVDWIGVRPARDVPMRELERVEAHDGAGLAGDRYTLSRSGSGKRGITLLQAEHLPAIAALSGHAAILPATLRRNLVVSGIPLVALKDRRFRIGEVLLEGTGPCDPCSRMEDALGQGGYNAMRGHGGICARILRGGDIRLGDAVIAVEEGA